jgi:phosphodiesterase/alkaline phosphatase D-like protein
MSNAQDKSIILGRPTDTTMTASVLFNQVVEYYLEYGTQSGNYSNTTATMTSVANQPEELVIRNLTGNTKYFYRMRYRSGSAGPFAATPQYTFHTQRAPGSTFRFNLEADEHLYDKKGIRNMYKVTLANQAKDSADFLMSLGDIFGDDHTPDATTSADMNDLHKDYLQYLKEVCHSVPFYVCLGNHEGENGFYLAQNSGQNIAVYGTQWRKYYYPNPYPNGFYTGNTTNEPYGIGMPENYYAWTWGDALFVVLDVYRDCSVNDKPVNWDWTLGFTQYTWLKNTLQNSNAKFKFVLLFFNCSIDFHFV